MVVGVVNVSCGSLFFVWTAVASSLTEFRVLGGGVSGLDI